MSTPGWQPRQQVTLLLPAAMHDPDQCRRAAYVLRRWAELTRDPTMTALVAEMADELTSLADTLTTTYDEVAAEVGEAWSRWLDQHGVPDE